MARHMALFGFALFLVSEAGVPGQLTLKQQRTLTDARAVIESIRRLGAHDALGVSADCLSACPAVENIGKSLNKEMEAVQLKHAGAMMASMGNQPQDGNMDAQAMADLFKAMEPMYADIMAVTINNMCDNKDGYACLVQNADKCSDSGGMNQGSMGMGMDPLTASKDMGAQLECMCTVCPATKDKYIKMMSTIMIETMSALTTGLASMGEALASGTATEEQLTEETMANVDTKELEQKMMLAVCPLVGMKPCFEANPTECKGMIDQGFSKVEARRRLNSSAAPSLSHEFATLEADCKKAGVSTAPPATNEKVTTVVTLQGLDYDKVMADAAVKDGIIATVKSKFLANMPGYKESDLTQIADTDLAIKKASQVREAENAEFQTTVADQRATQEILKKALDKLTTFYKKAFLQRAQQEPPVKFGAYTKNAGATPVISMIESIISDSKALEDEAVAGEAKAQASYETFVKDSNDLIASLNEEISEKTKASATAKEDLENAKSDLENTEGELESLALYQHNLHQECDWLLKNFEARQKARLDEIEAIQEAKAYLSGMK